MDYRMLARLDWLGMICAALAAAQPATAESAAGATPHVACIDSDRIAAREGESDRTILFRMQGGTTWRNTLRGACPGLAEVGGFRTLVTEQHGTQLCSGDLVRAVDPVAARATGFRSFAACPLGDFTPVAETARARRR